MISARIDASEAAHIVRAMVVAHGVLNLRPEANMGMAAVAVPLDRASDSTRVAYLQRVLGWTVGGLAVAGVTGFASAAVIASQPWLQTRWAMLIGILGFSMLAQVGVRGLVFSGDPAQRTFGFVAGAAAEGVAMGWLLLAAMAVSLGAGGSALGLIGTAMGATVLTGVGLAAYTWTAPRELSMVKAGMSAMFLPMIALMILSFVFPIGGPIGIALAGLFVVMSAAGLLWRVNEVLHTLRSDMHVEGAYLITMGVLVLFWNVLSLLMRLQRR
jgi:FtsH-binding integral membrane protein